MFSLDGTVLERLFVGLPIAPDLPADPAKAVGGCYPGYFPDQNDYGCNGGEICPWVALCRFDYSTGCEPYYFPFPECWGCASDDWCVPW